MVLYLVAVVKFTDMGAYCVGCTIGRHKLIPRISPAKSWEGSIGGVITGVAASLGMYAVTGGDLRVVTLTVPHAIVLGVREVCV